VGAPIHKEFILILDIGAGDSVVPLEGEQAIPVDLYVEQPNGIRATMWDIPLEDESVDEIYSRNALEHIGKFQVIPTLKEWWRILKVGGVLNLAVPDLVWACEHWLKYQDTSWNMDIIYGNQNHEGEYHKTGFTVPIVWDYLSKSGTWFIHNLDFVDGTGWAREEDKGNGIIRIEATQRMIGLRAIKVVPPKEVIDASS
jgi:predicted SAM-dependent methyltransferase